MPQNRLRPSIRALLESQFYPELESHICTWLGNQLSGAVKRKASNRCATPSAGVMLTEYYFSVFPTGPAPDVQAAQLSNYIRQPYNQAHYRFWSDSESGIVEGFHSDSQGSRGIDAVTPRYEEGVFPYYSTSCS